MGLRAAGHGTHGAIALAQTRAHCVFCCDAGPVHWTSCTVKDGNARACAGRRCASSQRQLTSTGCAKAAGRARYAGEPRRTVLSNVQEAAGASGLADLLHASQLLPQAQRRRARSSIGWADIRRPSVLTPTREAVAIRLCGLLRVLHGHGPAHAGRSG